MDLKSLIGIGGVPFVIGLVELVKRTFPSLPARFYPAIAVLWGIILNVTLAAILTLDYGTQVVIGVVAGLGAAGLFGYGKQQEAKSDLVRQWKQGRLSAPDTTTPAE